MASRSYEFLARRGEVLDILLPLIDELRLVVLVDGGGVEPMRVVSPESLGSLDVARPARFQLATSVPPPEVLAETVMTPAKWGWVSLELPEERGHDLLQGSLAAKNDWFEGDVRNTNEASYGLFAQLKKALKRHAHGSVFVRNVVTGASGPAKNLGVMEGARAWVAAGGQLRDAIARNIAYDLADPA
jgi:hypothetical protein